jgi:hypothetical protein
MKMKILIASTCAIIITAGGVAARDRYMQWSCLKGARTFATDIVDSSKSHDAYRANDACEKSGWIEVDAWRRF